MKKLFLFASILAGLNSQAQLGIGTTAPHASSQLEISSVDKGALLPRMTESQRLAIQNPAEGLLVFQTGGSEGFYYYDGNNWANIIVDGDNRIATGTIVAYAGSTAPEGWMLCSGTAISRSSYPDLFNVIGINYGTGDGSSTFNLPDLRGRTIFGRDDMGGISAGRISNLNVSGQIMGEQIGSQSVSLAVANMASHKHTFTGSSVTTNNNSHAHTYQDAYYAENGSGGYGNNSRVGNVGSTDTDNSFYWRTSSDGHSKSLSGIPTGGTAHSHTFTAAGTLGNTGLSNAFSVVNPAIVVNYIIKL